MSEFRKRFKEAQLEARRQADQREKEARAAANAVLPALEEKLWELIEWANKHGHRSVAVPLYLDYSDAVFEAAARLLRHSGVEMDSDTSWGRPKTWSMSWKEKVSYESSNH